MAVLTDRVPGLRPRATQRNVLVVLAYLLSILVGVNLIARLPGLLN
jgi:hypothetical protein